MSNKNLIAICGRSGSGKDTICNVIQYLASSSSKGYPEGKPKRTFEQYLANRHKQYSQYYSEYENKKFAEKLLNVVCVLHGIRPSEWLDREFKEENRHILTGVANKLREYDPDIWVNALFTDYTEEDKWIISDLRFPNELEEVLKHKGIVVEVYDNNLPPLEEKNADISEYALKDYTRLMEWRINNTEKDYEKLIPKVRLMLKLEGII